MPPETPPLFTRRFFVMCGFTFTVFLAEFQLLPAAPFRILAIGGGTVAAGLFLGVMTYASALSAPFTGALGDRAGRRRMLIAGGAALTLLSAAYAVSTRYELLLVLAVVHGLFWSGLLACSSAYLVEIVPATRRAEGIAYWGMSSIAAVAVAPALGLWLYERSWVLLCGVAGALNLLLVIVALTLPADTRRRAANEPSIFTREALEWGVVRLSITLFLCSFGYGGITSFVALYADSSGIAPKGLFFTTYALAILLTRPLIAPLADRAGHRRLIVPCLAAVVAGQALLPLVPGRAGVVLSAAVFGAGFGSAYPVFAAYVMSHVSERRRAAAFGGILAAFDTGIGSGSIVMGWIIGRYGYREAFAAGAAVAALAMPYFLVASRRFGGGRQRDVDGEDLRFENLPV
jgi:MFS family permease